jgi:hypothetical protein
MVSIPDWLKHYQKKITPEEAEAMNEIAREDNMGWEFCPYCGGDNLEFAERWDGGINPVYQVVYCRRPLCGWEGLV